eukprot:265952-Prymnesium_polylepis.1
MTVWPKPTAQRQITPHSSQDVTPELVGLAGYIMARSNSAHKLPGYIKTMLRLSQRPRGLLPPAARR